MTSSRVIVFVIFALASLSPTQLLTGQVVINELMASNSLHADDPDFESSSDWIELYNASDSEIDLGGWFVTDNLSDTLKWAVPLGTFIPAEGHLVLWCDGENTVEENIHTSFKLSSLGEELGVYNAELTLVDSLVFSGLDTDVSFGRVTDGNSEWAWFNVPTRGTSNDAAEPFDGISYGVPYFSVEGGFYEEAFTLELSGLSGVIRYTTDGRAPTAEDDEFSSALTIDSTAFVRARVFEDGFIPGPVVTHSYFFDPTLADRPLPVFSLVTDPDHFWDADTGIYVQDFKPEWEWPLNVEFFENDGNNEAVFNERAGVKVNGQNSWVLPQKMLGIYFRGGYGSGSLDYPLFHDRDRSKFDNFVLRASGSDWSNTLMRDGLSQSLPQVNAPVDHQGFRPSIVFINGAYMGIHNIRSRVDEEFVQENHGIEAGNLDLITDDGGVEEGNDSAFVVMDALFNEDLSDQANFDAAAAEVNMINFADYWATEIWASNSSWGHNVVQWKPKVGGKWHYVFTDLDRGFSGSTNDAIDGFTVPQDNNYDYARTWIRHALENDGYAAFFAQRFADHLHTSFHPQRVHGVIDAWAARIAPEIPFHVARWTGTTSSYGDGIATVDDWNSEIESLRTFATERSPFMLADLASEFGLGSQAELYTDNVPAGAGRIRLNAFQIPESPWSGPYFEDMPLELTAEPRPGYTFLGWSQVGTEPWVIEGSAWAFHDAGSDLGTEWTATDYDDSAWATGNAELGYGDGDEATVVSYGDDAQNKHITTYFRHAFDPGLTTAAELTGFFKLRRDDGAVVYVNGEEVFRSNLPEGEIMHTTPALDPVGGAAESNWYEYAVPIEWAAGFNVIAVEIHQVSPTSSDISFDLTLSVYSPFESIFSAVNPLPMALNGDAGYVARYEPTGECILPLSIDEDVTLTADCSPYVAQGTTTVAPDVTLTIEPGVEVWFPTDAQLLVQGQLTASGTAAEPLAFRLNPAYEAPWGNIQFDAATDPCLIRHAVIEDASAGNHPVHDRAAVVAWFSDITLDHLELVSNYRNPVYAEHSQVVLTNSTLHSDITGDLINVRHGSALIDSCTFIGNREPDTDAIDYDVVMDGVVRNTVIHSFRGPNSDGIDLGEGSLNILIEGGLIHHCTDKGISIGQASHAVIQNMTIAQCALGVALKDLGAAEMDHATFYGNQIAVSAYEKNPGMGGGEATVLRSIFSNSSDAPLFSDALSSMFVMDALYDTDTLAYDNVVEGNPLFTDPDGFDFELLEGSPAIGAAITGANYGSQHMWSVDQRDLAIVEFGYAGLEALNREWIRLENGGSESINLKGYRLEDAVTWVCLEDLWLTPGEALWVVKDAGYFAEAEELVREWDAGQLANEGERIVLQDADGIVVDFVRYAPLAPWPVPFAGSEALVRVAPTVDNHFASSWTLVELNEVEDVPEPGHANGLQVHPNPSDGSITVRGDFPESEWMDVLWFTPEGRLALTSKHAHAGGSMELDARSLGTGLYLLRIGPFSAQVAIH